MQKPFSLMIKETEEIIKTINNSNIPIFCLKQVLSNLYNQLDDLEKKEIEEYQKSLEDKKENKESEMKK